MKEIKSQADLSLEQYQKLCNIITKEDITKQDNLKIKSYFLNILDTLNINTEDMSMVEFEKQITNLMFLQTMPNNLVYEFLINGVEYKFGLDQSTQTVGEYSQLDSYVNNKTEKEIIDNLHFILAIFCRPVEKKIKFKKDQIKPRFYIDKKISKFNADEVEDRAKLFKKYLTADIAYSIVVFFSLFEIEYMQHILQSSVKEVINQG